MESCEYIVTLLTQRQVLGKFDNTSLRNAHPTFRYHRGTLLFLLFYDGYMSIWMSCVSTQELYIVLSLVFWKLALLS